MIPKFEKLEWRGLNSGPVCGVDEVGRGCLAGPVYAAAVILHPDVRILGLTDSKLLTPQRRLALAEEVQEKALYFSVAWASVEEIETLNILRASLLAMLRAVKTIGVEAGLVMVDGNQKIPEIKNQMTVIKGDLRVEPISAASILAKVARDNFMAELDAKYPGYGLASHKGYGTKAHFEAIRNLGASQIHRKTFSGVREYL